MIGAAELQDMVWDACVNDLEDFEVICSEVRKWALEEKKEDVPKQAIALALAQAVDEGRVRAFRFGDGQYVRAEGLPDLKKGWFLGKREAAGPDKVGPQPRG